MADKTPERTRTVELDRFTTIGEKNYFGGVLVLPESEAAALAKEAGEFARFLDEEKPKTGKETSKDTSKPS